MIFDTNVSLFEIMMHHWWWKDVSLISYPSKKKVQFTSWSRCGAASRIISVNITRFPKSYKRASPANNKISNPTRNQERYKTKQRHPARFTSVDFSSWDQWKKKGCRSANTCSRYFPSCFRSTCSLQVRCFSKGFCGINVNPGILAWCPSMPCGCTGASHAAVGIFCHSVFQPFLSHGVFITLKKTHGTQSTINIINWHFLAQ